MEFQDNNEEDLTNFPIDDISNFLKLIRLYAYCNYEASFTIKNKKNKDKEVEKLVKDSMYLLEDDSEKFMEDVISLTQVEEIALPYLKKDLITNEFIVDHEKTISQIITKVTQNIVYRFCNELVKMGLAELAWDDKTNDFIFISKDKK